MTTIAEDKAIENLIQKVNSIYFYNDNLIDKKAELKKTIEEFIEEIKNPTT